MFKRTVTMMLAAGTLVLGGCASNGGAEQAADNSDFDGKSIYLRGEMNDWMATDESKVAYSHAWRSLNNIHADHSITSMPIAQ